MILSATPFFSRSSTGVDAARSVVEALAPVTLVNLSDLSGWLFQKANMPPSPSWHAIVTNALTE